MIDAYTHLDISSPDPADDMRQRLAAAGLDGALLVETWDGSNRAVLDRLAGTGGGWKIALCFRQQSCASLARMLAKPPFVALRVTTAHLENAEPWLPVLQASGKLLLPHAEQGIGPLAAQVRKVRGVRVYLPHLGWPRRDGLDDPDWPAAIDEISRIAGSIAGVSALAHGSREPFPHRDVRRFAEYAIKSFGPERVVAGSDYPLLEKSRYADYMALARAWICAVWPDWSDCDALRAG